MRSEDFSDKWHSICSRGLCIDVKVWHFLNTLSFRLCSFVQLYGVHSTFQLNWPLKQAVSLLYRSVFADSSNLSEQLRIVYSRPHLLLESLFQRQYIILSQQQKIPTNRISYNIPKNMEPPIFGNLYPKEIWKPLTKTTMLMLYFGHSWGIAGIASKKGQFRGIDM